MPALTLALREHALRWLGLGLVLLAAALPAGTSQAATSGRVDGSHSQALKACSILTRADLRAVLGGAVSSKAQSQGPFSACVYGAKGRAIDFLIADQPSIKAKTPYTTTAGYWHVTTAYGSNKQTVKGLGKAATWLPQLGQLWVLKGTTMFSVIEFPVRQDSLALLTRLARRALTHL
jgi:hypothetical protein